ncbi:hypothetical protein [Bathymodiolus thermophilus thioautotrophic gill symbiont]|uniref:Uncharacterized protein n=1 Tax=Bathymodiolus thermophilus thioautotrophic gill symbiont TaxID=2360 RepID=A0A1J5U6X8_9GAMM|nr:hypothetical protein [Bathymodiolus thermophilus thioautotrophic gill symbiont]OIR24153.1 hypothetical protein BGC33_14455 [Bathymodiolus thermophilus thioautotrophic gill symbiont]
MKFKNIFFGFLKTLLLVAVFYGGSLYADGHMFLDLQNYQHVTNNSPYFFEIDPTTGNLVKVIDANNSFQFKTYNLGLTADVELYKAEVRPVLLRWGEGGAPLDEDFYSASSLSETLVSDVRHDIKGLFQGEVHVATYEGRIESVSYVKNIVVEVPEIKAIVANPWGMIKGQITNVKGAGSSLLDYMLQKFKNRGAERVRLYSIRDRYYLDRGWQRGIGNGACGR